MKYMFHVFMVLFAASASFAATVDLSTLTGKYTAQDGDVLTGTLEGETQHVKITVADGATVTLSDAIINGYNSTSYPWAGLTCLGNCTIVLEGSNTVKGFHRYYPGIQAAKQKGEGEEYTLTIEGDGSLDASSNGLNAGIGGDGEFGNIIINGGKIIATGSDYSAGIGSCDYCISGDIIINGGEVVAKGGKYAAGIGSGHKGSVGNITINGGKVTATGGQSSVGIGSGREGTCGNITISGGKVAATGGKWGAGIGGGEEGSFGNITISGGKVTATGGYRCAGIGASNGGKSGDITITNDVTKVVATKGSDALYSIGAVTIGGVDKGPIEDSPYEFIPGPLLVDLSTLTGDYEADDGETLTGTLAGNYKITIADGAKVTLRDAVINGSNDKSYSWAGITCLGNCTINLSGSNTVKGFDGNYPGIQAAKREGDGEEYTLTIEGDGSLEASSNGSGAGIGSGKNSVAGNITINGGKVKATGGPGAAGIGSGKQGTCGNVTVTNLVTKVVATKGTDAPYSIGAGYDGRVGTVTIGVDEGPIAESPYEFIPSLLVVNLSTLENNLEAKDGFVLTGTFNGNPDKPQPYMITIADGAEVTLRDAKINGTNEKVCKNGSDDDYCRWAGLTCLGNCTIVLSGSNTVKGFYENYPGVQAAKNEGDGDEYTLTIEGDGSLEASSNGKGAGIGGGYEVNCGNISINGGTVVATGGEKSAGIGSGYRGICGNITITNNVTKTVAVKGKNAPYSVGAGDGGEAGNVVIGGEENAPVEKELFIFPAPPAKLVNFETVASKTYAIIDGDYSGTDALNIAKDVSVDKVVFERTSPLIYATDNYYTIMFPFEISAKEVGNITSVFSFVGIDVDKQNRKVVAVEEVDKFEAYKPYLIGTYSISNAEPPDLNKVSISTDKTEPLVSDKERIPIEETQKKVSISIDNTKPLVLKKTPTKSSAFEVAQSSDYNKYGDYVFRGVVQTKTWGAEDDEVLGTDGAAAYGFASTATTDVKVGQFAKVGEGAYIRPFRGYIYKKPVPKKVKSNGDYVLRQTASIEELPDVMDIVVVDRKKDGSKQTTVIGQFNSRTGEIRMNRTERTYDLKGRSVRDASHMAKGVYLKK